MCIIGDVKRNHFLAEREMCKYVVKDERKGERREFLEGGIRRMYGLGQD